MKYKGRELDKLLFTWEGKPYLIITDKKGKCFVYNLLQIELSPLNCNISSIIELFDSGGWVAQCNLIDVCKEVFNT